MKAVYKPINEEKYIFSNINLGSKKTKYPYMRSSWEIKMARFLDISPAVKKWSSEPFPINYISPIDGKEHRYYPDFYAEFNSGDKFIIEVKPFKETKPPKRGYYKSEKSFKRDFETYIKNKAKWEAAKKFSDQKGMKFILVTEYELGLKGK